MNNKTNYHITPSLRQGEKYNSYQKKKGKTFNKSSSWVEGFTSQISPFLQTSDQDKLSKTQLTKQTKDILNETNGILNDSNSSLGELKEQYQDTLTKYNSLMNEINGISTNYVTRVGSGNPYLNKTVRFTSGHICYVTNQGVVKYIPTMEIWQGLIDNGCGSMNYIELDVPWLDTYWNPGTAIPTNPPLISGTNMELGQGCGNEGANVFVNNLVKNPTTTYLGCYNNLPPATEILFSPTTMTSTNAINGYVAYSSGVYYDNNDYAGPWCAFDNNAESYWHSSEDNSCLYNSTTGVYEGNNSIQFTDSTGNQQNNVRGEFLILYLPSPTVLTKYEILGRQDLKLLRDPNTWYILGDNGGWNQVDYQSEVSFNEQKMSFTVSNPKAFNQYAILITKVGCPSCTSNRITCQIAAWNLYTSSSYKTDSNVIPNMTQSSTDYVSYDQCSQYAIENGYNTFGLQNVQADGTGLCMVGQDTTQAQMYGEAFGYPSTNLWSSYTNNGVSAVLNNYGSLQVMNNSNAAVFSSEATNANPANYLGCYQDGGTRALPNNMAGGWSADYTSCMNFASSGGYSYFGIQATNWNGDGMSQCYAGNDLSQATSYGKASNCTTYNDMPSGGGWSNAVYSVNPSTGSNYFLILQDDGNMCIYRGTGPTDIQGLIWATNTNGKQQESNPLFSATKGKTGINYMVSGDTLNVNEFIGSTDGSMYLMMMPGGDLQLNTSTKASSCSTVSGKNVGGPSSNAVYQIDQSGYKSSMGQVGFVDGDSVLYTYPSSNVKYTNEYNKIDNMNSIDNDLPGTSFSNANVEQCKSTCNQNAECAGFVFDNQNNICWPKSDGMYPVGNTQIQSGISLYTRNKSAIQVPFGSLDTTTNIDSVQYNNYKKSSSDPPTSAGLVNATSYQKQQLSQLQDQLNLLSASITNYTNQFTNESTNINKQSTNNAAGLSDFLNNMEQTTVDIHNEKRNLTNIGNIERQVNLQTLQHNYQYMFWTILAGAAILIIINMKRNFGPP